MDDRFDRKALSLRGGGDLVASDHAGDAAIPFAVHVGERPAEAGHDLRSALRHLWFRRWTIAITTLVGGALTYAAVSPIPSFYTAEARLVVGVPGPRGLNVETVIADMVADAERVQNEGLILRSRPIAAQVVEDLHLDRNAEFNPELAEPPFWSRAMAWFEAEAPSWLSGLAGRSQTSTAPVAAADEERKRYALIDRVLERIDASTLGRSHILSIKAEARDPALAADIANTFAQKYVQFQRGEKVKAMERVDAFLMQRIAELREQVNKSEQAVEDYRRAHNLYRSGNSNLATQQLSDLNTQLLAAQTAMVEAETRLTEARAVRQGRADIGSVSEVLHSPLIVALKGQLADAERRAAQAAATYGERHPQFRSIQAEAGSLSARVAAEMTKIVDGLERDANTARARHAALAQQFEKAKATTGAVNDKSIPLEALERDAASDRKLLETMLSQAKQSRGTGDLMQAGAKLVSAAVPPDKPSSPHKVLLALLGALLAFLVAATATLIREAGNRTFRRPEQVEEVTGLPVLTMVPRVAGRSATQNVVGESASSYNEAVRRLHVGIELSDVNQSPKRLLFSSATPAEGKSVMVASLARQLANDGKRVIVVDGDWRRPRMHVLMRCRRGPGLGELLADETATLNECVQRDSHSTVDLIAAGTWDVRASHLLTSPRMGALLDLLAKAYDVVLVDTAPVLVTADALGLSRMADKVIYAVRWGHTRQDTALAGLRQFVDVGADVAGIALTRVEIEEYRLHSDRKLSFTRMPILAFR